MRLVDKLQLQSIERISRKQRCERILKDFEKADLRRPAGIGSHAKPQKSIPHGVIAKTGITNELNIALTVDGSG